MTYRFSDFCFGDPFALNAIVPEMLCVGGNKTDRGIVPHVPADVALEADFKGMSNQ